MKQSLNDQHLSYLHMSIESKKVNTDLGSCGLLNYNRTTGRSYITVKKKKK